MMTKRNAGVTLIELMIASTILSAVIGVALLFMEKYTTLHGVEFVELDLERRLQYALDEIVIDLKEANASKVSYFDYLENDRWQTFVCFPTARQKDSGKFVYTDETDTVTVDPQWQGIIVYGVYPGTSEDPGWLVRYADYTSGRDFLSQMPYITDVDSTTITMSDGTTFDRASSKVNTGTRLVSRLAADIKQLVRTPEPVNPAIYPLSFNLIAEKKLHELRGQALTVTSSTSVFARNNN